MKHLPNLDNPADSMLAWGSYEWVDIMTKAQAAGLRVKWAEGEHRPCKHLHLELEHNNDDYLTDNYHCTACGELVAANTRDPFQVI